MPIASRITDPPFHANFTVLDGVDPNPPPYGIIAAACLICEYSTVDHLAVKSKAKNQSPDQVLGHMAMEMEPCFGPLYQSYLCCSLRIPRQHLTRNNSEIHSLQIPRVSTVKEYLAAAHGASIQSQRTRCLL
jgi:hypothetical protein